MEALKLDYFVDIVEFAAYAQGVDHSIEISSIYPSYQLAKYKLIEIIGEQLYLELKNDEISEKYIKSILANYTMLEYFPFMNLKKAKEDQMYKYQVDQSRDQYGLMAWSFLDNLLNRLENSENTIWKEQDLYKETSKLYVKDAKKFNYYYNINNSSLFFYKTLYLQREVLEELVEPRLGATKFEDLADKQQDNIKRLICYEILSRVILTFEKNELPPNIRKKLRNEFSNDDFEVDRANLYKYFKGKADKCLDSLDSSLAAQRGHGDIINRNSEKNKFYLV